MTSAHETDADEVFLAPVEAYRLLDVSPRTFRRYRAAGVIVPAYTLPSGHARFRRSDIVRLIEQGTRAGAWSIANRRPGAAPAPEADPDLEGFHAPSPSTDAAVSA